MRNAKFDPMFIFEAFGTRVNQSYDCLVNNPDIALSKYRSVVVSRHLACRQHQERVRRGATGECMPGLFPIIDDEYAEFVDVLTAVTEHDPKLPFVIVELGARYATWAVRGVQAARQRWGKVRNTTHVLTCAPGMAQAHLCACMHMCKRM